MKAKRVSRKQKKITLRVKSACLLESEKGQKMERRKFDAGNRLNFEPDARTARTNFAHEIIEGMRLKYFGDLTGKCRERFSFHPRTSA